MSRRTTILGLAVLIGLAGACAKDAGDPAEVAWSEFTEAWSQLETAEDKTQLAEGYLAKFPNTEHSGLLARRVVYYRGHEMEDARGAFDAIYPELAQRFGVELYPFFLEGVAARPELNQGDGIHPNAEGVALIVRQMLPHLLPLIEKERAEAGS